MVFIKSGLTLKFSSERGESTWKRRTLVLESECKTLQIFADTDSNFANVLAFLDVAAGAAVQPTKNKLPLAVLGVGRIGN